MKLKEFFATHHVPFEVVGHSTSWCASRLAEATHTRGKAVAKSVLLHANHGYVDVIAVVPADHKLDLNKVSQLLGGAEVRLASEDDIVQHCPHCERGVLPPFGSQYAMKTVIDRSFADQETILFEGESHSEAIRMKFSDYCRLENPLIGSIAQDG